MNSFHLHVCQGSFGCEGVLPHERPAASYLSIRKAPSMIPKESALSCNAISASRKSFFTFHISHFMRRLPLAPSFKRAISIFVRQRSSSTVHRPAWRPPVQLTFTEYSLTDQSIQHLYWDCGGCRSNYPLQTAGMANCIYLISLFDTAVFYLVCRCAPYVP